MYWEGPILCGGVWHCVIVGLFPGRSDKPGSRQSLLKVQTHSYSRNQCVCGHCERDVRFTGLLCVQHCGPPLLKLSQVWLSPCFISASPCQHYYTFVAYTFMVYVIFHTILMFFFFWWNKFILFSFQNGAEWVRVSVRVPSGGERVYWQSH